MADLDPTGTPANLPFAWWNTKIAPPSFMVPGNEAHLTAATDVVQDLIQRQGCLLIALAEVRQQPVLGWVPAGLRSSWGSITDTSRERHDFDVAMIFDRTRLLLADQRWVREPYAGQMVRAGLVATFALLDDSGWLVVAAAHWRSDSRNARDAGYRRSTAAKALYEAIVESLHSVGDPTTPVLILGDFNAEPFEEPFGGNLPTARSRAEVQRHQPRALNDLLFYNAAWRWLGEQYPWDHTRRPPSLAGTYRMLDGRVPTVWRTFDQVLVSPSLLGAAPWSLDEVSLRIVDDTRVFDETVGRPRPPFDHLPIVGRLQRSALDNTDTAREP